MLNRRQKPPSPKMLALGPVATESIIPVSAYGSRRPLFHRKQDGTARDHRISTECHNKWELVFYALETLEGMRRVLLCRVEAVEGELCLLEVLEMPEVMRC